MNANVTTTAGPVTTAPDTNQPGTSATPFLNAGEWLIGDVYDSTAHMPMTHVAEKVHTNLCNVRADGLLPATAEFAVTVDSNEPIPVLRIDIAGLIDETFTATSAVYDAMRVVFGLANHYNRVNLAHPGRARFIQHITALRPDGAPGVVLIGMMHNVAIG